MPACACRSVGLSSTAGGAQSVQILAATTSYRVVVNPRLCLEAAIDNDDPSAGRELAGDPISMRLHPCIIST